MTLEDLVAPIWFAKKLPKQVTALWWCLCDPDEPYVVPINILVLAEEENPEHYLAAPTTQEMLPLLIETGKKDMDSINQEYSEEFHLQWNQTQLKKAFGLELVEKGNGWKYLDNLLFEK